MRTDFCHHVYVACKIWITFITKTTWLKFRCALWQSLLQTRYEDIFSYIRLSFALYYRNILLSLNVPYKGTAWEPPRVLLPRDVSPLPVFQSATTEEAPYIVIVSFIKYKRILEKSINTDPGCGFHLTTTRPHSNNRAPPVHIYIP